VHIMSGLICSGKTTLANILAKRHDAEVFSADDWMIDLLGPDFPVESFQLHGDGVKALIWNAATRFLSRGVDVVLDFSLWFRWERDKFHNLAREVGAEPQLYQLNTSDELLWSRLRARNANLPRGTFFISEETFEMWRLSLEPAQPEENPVRVISGIIEEKQEL